MGKGIYFSIGICIAIAICIILLWGFGTLVLYCIGALVLWYFGAGAGNILGSCEYSSVHRFLGAGSGIGTNVDAFQHLGVNPQCILKVYM